MSHQSDLIATDINAYLAQHERKELLRFLTCGSVDDGKSTLIGRLLHDSKMIYEDQLEAIKSASIKAGTTAGEFDLALLTDGLQAEREQGITIDVAYRYFSTTKRKFIIADTPGHEQYTRNMVTGASNCDLAIILIDARHGVMTQTRRHSYIASLLGIKHLVVAINKMDLKGYSEQAFKNIQEDYLQFAKELAEFVEGEIKPVFIPISALNGDNVVNPSELMAWYNGPTLMELLEHVQVTGDDTKAPWRYPVQYVNRPNLNFRGYCGTIASGTVSKGDYVSVMPSGLTSKVKSIITYEGELETASSPLAVTITLEDEIDISRGDMLIHPEAEPEKLKKFTATLVWMSETPLKIGQPLLLKHTSRLVSGVVSKIHYIIDVNTLTKGAATQLELNAIASCELTIELPIYVDKYAENPSTGSFIIIDRFSNITVGAGMIKEVSLHTSKTSSSHSQRVNAMERSQRYAQSPVTLLFIGLSGTGKSTLAHAVERRLFDRGNLVTVIDGKALRQQLSKDLKLDSSGRSTNLKRGAAVAQLLNEAGHICCAAFTGASAEARAEFISIIGQHRTLVIALEASLNTCQERDPSGIYTEEQFSREGLIPGISYAFEWPSDPDLSLPTDQISVEECVDRVLNLLKEREFI